MFTINSKGAIDVDPDILIIPEFKAIWVRDKSTKKEKVKNELSYIYQMCDYKSSYAASETGDSLRKLVGSDCMKDENYVPDKMVKAAMEKYESLQESRVLKTFKAADSALDQVRLYFEDIDLSAEKNLEKKNKIALDILKAIKEIPEVAVKLDKARRDVERELKTQGKTVGGGHISDREKMGRAKRRNR